MKELDRAKYVALVARGWHFGFYPAEIVEVYRPDEVVGELGEVFGAWNLPYKVECFFDEEFGDGSRDE